MLLLLLIVIIDLIYCVLAWDPVSVLSVCHDYLTKSFTMML